METRALIPLKSPDAAKTRLSEVLSASARRELYFELAQRVIEALQATPGITSVFVITSSDEVEAFALSLGAEVLRQPQDGGTTAAFAYAIEVLRIRAYERILLIAGDLPLLKPEALRVLFDAADDGAQVVLAPDRRGVGTNALLCDPPNAIAPSFGENSFSRHYAASLRCGYATCVVEHELLGLDLDVAADLDELQRIQTRDRYPPMAALNTFHGGVRA